MENTNNTNVQEDNVVRQNNIIQVDEDFNGDLESAIAAAEDGDTVFLGRGTYTTSGITIEKDITLDGFSSSTVIEGDGTDGSIITLTSSASGATVRDLQITDGNIGVSVQDANDVTMDNLEIHNIGIEETIREGQNNIGVSIIGGDRFRLTDSDIYNIGRKGVGINDADGGIVSGLTIEDINLDAEHAQSYDAGGIKLFNTNDVIISENELSGINAFAIWSDITSGTEMRDNVVTGVGEDFLQPDFNPYVDVGGIYNEKSYESVVEGNTITTVDDFTAFRATEFSTETMTMQGNDFSTIQLNTEDFWANERAERLIAITEDPDAANFDLYADDFFAEAIITD